MSATRGVAGAAALAVVALASPAGAAEIKTALSVFHFNVQYVAGGLTGFLAVGDPALELSAEQVEDAIVTESFDPVLDIFVANAGWGAGIEMQGYMLDILAERHPAVLDKLRALAVSGQVEVMSFHYSDQLFLGYPSEDWRRSAILTRETFEKHGVPLSPAVFCQEGQAGPGLAAAMAEMGYETLVYPKNLFTFQHGDLPKQPLYRWGDGVMLTYEGIQWTDGVDTIDTIFWFVDDGELLATDDNNPYFPELFYVHPEVIAEEVANLQALEDAGYVIGNISEYVATIEPIVGLAEPPPLLDGTWQPGSTDGIKRWLGGAGLWVDDERDNDVRTLGALAHRELLAAEVIAAEAGLEVEAEIAAGFRLLALGQVTDATGINPFRGEVEYGISHLTEALRIARGVVRRGKAALGAAAVSIDTRTGEVKLDPEPPAPPVPIEPRLEIEIESGERSADVVWLEHEGGRVSVDIAFSAGDSRFITARFPGDVAADIVFTPGLSEEPVSLPRDAFAFEHFDIALSDGLIGLGAGRFLVKDQGRVHLSARIYTDSGAVQFADETMPRGEPEHWRFWLVEGSLEEAAALAREINVEPIVWR